MEQNIIIIFLVVLIIVLVITKAYTGVLVAVILLVLQLSNNSVYKLCAEAFHMGTDDAPSAYYMEDSLDGQPSTYNYHADKQHQSVADLGGENFIPVPDNAGNYLGDNEDITGLNMNEYPTGMNEIDDDNADIKAKYDPDIAQWNSAIFSDNQKINISGESPIIQDVPERIDNNWFLKQNEEVNYDNVKVTGAMEGLIDNESDDPWLKRQKFMSQSLQDNEYYNSLSKVDVWRDEIMERFGNSLDVPSWTTQYNPSDNWDAS